MTRHAAAIASLLIADLSDTKVRRVARTMEKGYLFSNLRSPLSRQERRGFDDGDTVRETMKSHKQGFGLSFSAVHPLNLTEREQVVEALNAAGFAATLTRASGCYMITF